MQALLNETLSQEQAEEMWKKLDEACCLIQIQEMKKKLSFSELYNCAYKLVFHKYGEMVYTRLQERIRMKVDELLSSMYADNLTSDFVAAFEQLQDFEKQIHGIFLYMEKNFIQAKKQKTIQFICYEAFKFRCFDQEPQLYNKLLQSLIQAVRNDRLGVARERKLKEALQILIMISGKLEFKNNDFNERKLTIQPNEELYRTFFERKLQSETSKFYREYSQEQLKYPVDQFITGVQQKYDFERLYVEQTLPKSSWDKITNILIQQCIQSHIDYVLQGFGEFLQDERQDMIVRVNNLVILNDDSFAAYLKKVSSHIKSQGTELIKVQGPQTLQVIMDYYDQTQRLLSGLDGTNDQKYSLQKAISNSFEWLLNLDSFISHELNRYFDQWMKRQAQSDEEIDLAITRGFNIFKLITSKDQFEVTYRKFLCLRLLEGSSVSQDQERSMLNRFKLECGAVLTKRMETMFADLKRSTSDTIDFKRTHTIDFEITVLTTGNWPLADPVAINLIDELGLWKQQFEAHYQLKNANRKLQFHLQLGFVNLRANFDPTNKKEFICSVLQANILLLFNQPRILTLQKINTILNADAASELQSLVQIGILIQDQDSIQLNYKFTHRSYKIKLQKRNPQEIIQQKKKEQQSIQTEELDREVILDRKLYLESLIVRVLKARKQLDHQELFKEIDKDKRNRSFIADTGLLKTCIESLIQKDYLQRVDLNTYIYRA